MNDIFNQMSELGRLGKFEQIIKLVKEEIKNESTQKRRFQLEMAQLEANYNLRNFQLTKTNVEKLLNQTTIENYPSILGDAHNLLGKIFRIHQRYQEALNHYQMAENAYKLSQDNQGLAKIYINIGNAYIFLEKFKTANKFHKKALNLAYLMENNDLIANCYLNLGGMNYQNGKVEKALNYFKKALKIFEMINDVPALAAVHLNIAETFFLRRNFSESSSYSAKAIYLYKQQKHNLGQNLALKSFARAEKEAGNHEIAAKSLEELLKLQDSSLNEDVMLELGECYLALKRISQAEEIFQTLRKTINYSPQSRGYALNSLAIISGEKGDFLTSIIYYKELLGILSALPVDDEDSKASTKGNLACMYLKMNKFEDAFRYLESALDYFKKRKIWEEATVLINNFATELVVKKEYDKYLSFIEDYSLPLAKKAKNKPWRNHLHYDVSFLYYLIGKSNKGIQYWKKHVSSNSTKQYKPKFISNSELLASEREKLELVYRKFLKLIS